MAFNFACWLVSQKAQFLFDSLAIGDLLVICAMLLSEISFKVTSNPRWADVPNVIDFDSNASSKLTDYEKIRHNKNILIEYTASNITVPQPPCCQQ